MLAGDPLAFGLIYILKFSCNSSYFIGQVSKNISLNCGNTSSVECLQALGVLEWVIALYKIAKMTKLFEKIYKAKKQWVTY